MKLPFARRVSEGVARNPVARAMARRSMLDVMRGFLIHVYMMPDGSESSESVKAASTAIAVALRVLDARGEATTPDYRVMHGAMSALSECSKRRFIWHSRDAAAIDSGLTRAQQVVAKATADELHDAWAYIRGLG